MVGYYGCLVAEEDEVLVNRPRECLDASVIQNDWALSVYRCLLKSNLKYVGSFYKRVHGTIPNNIAGYLTK